MSEGRQSPGARILVIDDEGAIRRLLKVALGAHGYRIEEASSGKEGIERTAFFHPDLIILDLGLPDIDGIQVVKRLREWSSTPIIVLTVCEAEEDKIEALDSGADDYVVKPFAMGELLARIRASLRHAAKNEVKPVIAVGDLSIDLVKRRVTVNGKEVKLTPIEYEILKHLAQHEGRVLTHRHLLKEIWGEAYQDETHYLRVYVGHLRRKIEPDPSRPRYIITEAGVGYRLAEDL